MTSETSNLHLVIATWLIAACAVIAEVRKWLAARKSAENKATGDISPRKSTFRTLAKFSGIAAVVAALVLSQVTIGSKWPSVCALYYFIVQGVLFASLQRPATRNEILSVVLAALFFASTSIHDATIALWKTQSLLAHRQYDLAHDQSRMIDVQTEASRTEADILSTLKMLALPTPTPSPSSTPHQ